MKLSKLTKQLFILEDTPNPVIIVGVNEILSLKKEKKTTPEGLKFINRIKNLLMNIHIT